MRVTINIDDAILRDVRKLQEKERKPLGTIVSYLLAIGLNEVNARMNTRKPFRWISKRMEERIDLNDKEAVFEAVEGAHIRRLQRNSGRQGKSTRRRDS